MHSPEKDSGTIETLLLEERKYPPSPDFVAQANVSDPDIYERATQDPVAFWRQRAGVVEWFKEPTETLVWEPPFARWFGDGELNACYNCVDRHLQARGDKIALIWEGEPGDRHTLTYAELYREVNRTAQMLNNLGIEKGDRVAIYMPMIPEAAIAMLACARIGAPHTVVFGGFSPESLRDRINDAGARVLITADGGFRRGQVVPLKRNADEAVRETPTIEHVIVVMRGIPTTGQQPIAHMTEGRDHWWHRLMADERIH